MVRFVFEAGVGNILARTRSHVRTHAALLRFSEVDCAQSDCLGWYHYQYDTADVLEVPPTHSEGRSYPGSKPRTREGVKVAILFHIKAMLDEEIENAWERLVKTWATLVDDVPRVNSSVGDGIGLLVTDDMKNQVALSKNNLVKATQLTAVTVEENVMRKMLAKLALNRGNAR